MTSSATPFQSVPDAVRIENLTKTFKLNWRRGRLLALDNLNLTIKQGEVFGLLGPNGSGKSTTMKLMLGLIRPTKGSVTLFGHPAGSMKAQQKVGFLPENPYFPAFLNGREVLHYYGGLVNLRGSELKDRAQALLEQVRLTDAASRPLRTYSKGMLQRIGLAQALLHDPDLLLLDEPTAGVDPVGSREIRDLILMLKERGKTVVFSSHLLEQVQEVSDRVAIIYLGQKLSEGTLAELLTVREETELRARHVSPETEARLRAVLAEAGAGEVRISHPQQSLEDYFIQTLEKSQKS